MRSQSLLGAGFAGLLLLLSACGGSGDAGLGDDGGTTGSTTGGTTGTTTDPVPRIGVLSGTTFTAGVIAVAQSSLEAGGSTDLRVDIVDTANGNVLITDAVSVSFSSSCASQGLAQITSPVTSTGGSATTTYQALGCSGEDVITASATVDGQTLSATATVDVEAAEVASIQFVSATPAQIRIRGSGQPETSTVIFQVINTAGGPAPGVQVAFSLDTSVGGITLTPATATTDSSGRAQTVVRSGTVHTSVRVTATVVGMENVLPSQSDSLVISTGLADQDSFSLSVGCHNIEGATIDGTQTDVTIRAADRFNNPVPDGTAIAFTTEGGSIQPQCLTAGGACSVKFTTQQPRQGDHRVTVLATAIGEESFVDVNGDGRYDSGESFVDLGEAFLDRNQSGIRDSNEEFVDFNNSGSFTGPSGNFTGVLCDTGCDTARSLNVREQQYIIMSGSSAVIVPIPSSLDLSNGAAVLQVLVSDDANQPMPGGTTVVASTTFGTIVGDSTQTQPCTSKPGPHPFTFIVSPPDNQTEAKSGVLTLKVTSPSGIVSTLAVSVSFSPPEPEPEPEPPAGELGSIKFLSAEPGTIGVRGTGLQETSTVKFQVFSDTGVAIANQPVTFQLSTTVGGIELTPVPETTEVSTLSDSSGVATVIVRAGTVHTSVRVKAIAADEDGTPTVTALSELLTITTGLPDQNSVSLSMADLNPEGFDLDGVVVPVFIRAADRFNNPVPDGTAFAFTTSGGAIDGDCVTVDGACTVDWVSQAPRVPRAIILATAIGEESFTDLSGDGRYDDGEPFTNLPEPWRDDDLDGVYDSASEEFQDFNGDGRRNDPNDPASPDFESPSRFTGTLCDGPTRCDPNAATLYVSDSIAFVMSGSAPAIDLCPPTTDIIIDGGSFTNPTCTPSSIGTPTVTVDTQDTGNGGGATATFSVVIRDANDQPLPSGTSISLVNDGGDITITPTASYVVPETTDDSAGGNTFTWSLTDEAFVSGDQFGAMTLTVRTPSGRTTTIQLKLVLNDTTP